MVFGIAACPFLSLLACLDTDRFPDAHNYCAYLFFIFYIIFESLTTVTASHLGRARPELFGLSYKLKLVITILAGVFFFIYIPVGLGVVYGSDKCAFQYDEATKQWDYSNCSGLHVLRAVFQQLTALCFLVFTGSMYEDLRVMDARPATAHNTFTA
mmetsp:Transcript_6943/g.15947  ORF Transcript_6943/g.15947 Transcript_6943/m.15947 type:complete len:156 (+) Transcript_6943:306-773(+)